MEQRIVSMFLRWMWLLILATVLSGLAAYWFGTQQPAEYEASIRLIVGPGVDGLSPDLNDLRAGAQLMQTYSALATTRPVLQAVVDELGLEESPQRLRTKIAVRDNSDTQILTIFVRDEDPLRAAAIANSMASVLLRLSPSGGESPAALLMSQIRSQAATIEGNIITSEERILQLEEDLQAATTAQEQQLYIDRLAQERARLAESQSTLALLLDSLLNTPTNQVKIVEPAIIGVAISQSLPLLVLIGGAAGLLFAATGVVGYEYLDRSIKSADELEGVAGVAVIATVALEDKEKYGQPESLTVRSRPQSAAAEEYRRLATKLPLLRNANPLQTIVVSGLDDKIGTSGANEIAANLAIVLAQTGIKVLLLDANLTYPTVHKQFSLPTNRGGLTDLLHNRTSRPQFNTIEDVPGLSVLASGAVSSDAFSDLASPMTRELLDNLQQRVDVIVVAAPPVSVAASLFLVSQADGVVLVVQRGSSSVREVEDSVSNLRAIDVQFLGMVLAVRKWGMPTWLRKLGRLGARSTRRPRARVRSTVSGARDAISNRERTPGRPPAEASARLEVSNERMEQRGGTPVDVVPHDNELETASGGDGVDLTEESTVTS